MRRATASRGHSLPSEISQHGHGRKAHCEHMAVVTQLLTAVGTVTAVVVLLLMATIPLLIDLPLHSEGR
jgi:hypothetical protein